jgi:hypothetical protein
VEQLRGAADSECRLVPFRRPTGRFRQS